VQKVRDIPYAFLTFFLKFEKVIKTVILCYLQVALKVEVSIKLFYSILFHIFNLFTMKKSFYSFLSVLKFSFALSVLVALSSCSVTALFEEEAIPNNEEPNVPDFFAGRNVQVQGTATVTSREVTFYLWDSGTIDDDIISFYVNGKKQVDTHTLRGPNSKREVKVTLEYEGYNYILLYAHNEGTISPNTCAISYDDGFGEQRITLSADLQTNGAYNFVVE
jgi:hypothetical protein